MRELRFDDSAALMDALAADLFAQLRDTLAHRPETSLVVPGGRTPVPLFARLARADLPWERIWIALGDERWVDTAAPTSNERLVREHLLQDRAAAARFVGLKNEASSARAGESASWQALAAVPRPFAAVVLGMGDDGHVASLFPGTPTLAGALDAAAAPSCVAMAAPSAPQERLSLNVAALLEARRIALLITGDAKWRVYQGARTPGAAVELPVRAVLHQQRVPVSVYWAPD